MAEAPSNPTPGGSIDRAIDKAIEAAEYRNPDGSSVKRQPLPELLDARDRLAAEAARKARGGGRYRRVRFGGGSGS